MGHPNLTIPEWVSDYPPYSPQFWKNCGWVPNSVLKWVSGLKWFHPADRDIG